MISSVNLSSRDGFLAKNFGSQFLQSEANILFIYGCFQLAGKVLHEWRFHWIFQETYNRIIKLIVYRPDIFTLFVNISFSVVLGNVYQNILNWWQNVSEGWNSKTCVELNTLRFTQYFMAAESNSSKSTKLWLEVLMCIFNISSLKLIHDLSAFSLSLAWRLWH